MAEQFVSSSLLSQDGNHTQLTVPRVLIISEDAVKWNRLRRHLSQHWQIEVASPRTFFPSDLQERLPALLLVDAADRQAALIRRVRQNGAQEQAPAIVAVVDSAEAALSVLQAGADDYLIKPFTQKELRLRAGIQMARAQARRPAGNGTDLSKSYLHKLSETLHSLADPIDIQYQAVRLLGESLDANRVGYAEDGGDGVTVKVTRNYTRGVPGIEGQYRYDDYGPELLRAFREGRTVVRNDIANDPTLTSAEKDAHAVLQLGSTVNMPLVKEGQLVAILFAHFIDAHDWTENELALMQETAERIWAAVERARAEAAQHASEEKYRTLFNSIDEGFCIIEMLFDESGRPADYRFLETNAAFEKQTGLQNCIGKTVREILPNHDAHWFEIYGRIARTGISERFEDPATALDRYYDVYAFRIGEPEARHVAVIFQDVSERKRSEAALRESESRQRFLLKLSDALRPHYDTAEIQREASRVLGEHLAANRVAYFEVMDDDYIVNHDYVNGVPNIAGRYPIHSFGETLLSIYQKGQPVTSADVQADAQLTPAERAAYASIQIGAYIGVPLVKQGRFIAGLAVHVAHPREWTALDVSLAQETAERTWAAIERAQAEQALHQLNAQLEQRVLDRTEALRQSHEQLQELSVHMEHAREDERTRIAREVHDELGGNLTALKIDLGSLATGRDADAALTQRIHDLKEHIDMIVRIVRRIGSDLRPPVLDDFGLVPAMEWHAREWERRTGIQCRLDLIEITSPISREKRTAVFRVFQEALTNVARHAQATRVNVTTGVDEGDLMLMIEDDGVGIRAGELDFSRSLGLKGMQERMKEVGGVVEIEGEAGQGTIIAIRVPLSEGTHTNE